MIVATAVAIDIFLSHGIHDTGIAGVVENALAEADLEVFSVQKLETGEKFLNEMRTTLAECSAVILILTRSTLGSSNLAFEVGAAMAWNKPIYVLYDGIAPSEIPDFLADLRVFQVSSLAAVVKEIAESQQPLGETDREWLVRVYEEYGVPSDQLLRKPLALRELTEKFNRKRKSNYSAEKLIQELIRLRKQGNLPRIKKQ